MYKFTTSTPYLLARAGARMGALFSRRLAPYGLTLPMYRVLAALVEQPSQTLGNLATMTSIDLSTMSRMIGTMRTKGLVTRERPPGNERTVSIDLTPKGRATAAELMKEAEHYEKVAVSRLSEANVAKLKQLLGEIYDSLDILEAEQATGNTVK